MKQAARALVAVACALLPACASDPETPAAPDAAAKDATFPPDDAVDEAPGVDVRADDVRADVHADHVRIDDAAPPEACNGLDDDGDGATDGPACPEVYACADASRCRCAEGWARCGAACARADVPTDACGGACALVDRDPENCGACGRACAAGRVCRGGACACPAAQQFCGDRCVALGSDPANCGRCGLACRAGLGCSLGVCACAASATLCGFDCVDPSASDAHCGGCGQACPPTQRCQEGRCGCPAGTTSCGAAPARCVDVTSDPVNCGACGRACPAGVACVGAGCACPTGPGTLCAETCVDLATSATDCGRCGNVCPPGARCARGACACEGAGSSLCEGRCVDLTADRVHCGRCDVRCGDASACAGGACTPRLVSPPAGARLGTRRPTFRWATGAGVVEVCAERACARVVAAFAGDSARASPAGRLDPGVYFWRVRAAADAPPSAARPLRIDGRDAARDGLLPAALDLDGDGLADVAVLARSGDVSVFFGARAGLRGPMDVRIPPPDPGFEAPSALEAVGDLQGDGFGDVALVGGPRRRIVRGAASAIGDVGFTTPDAPLPDLNGDGLADWLSALGVRYGTPDSWQPTGPSTPLDVGFVDRAVAVGDVNGDGYADAALGAPRVSPPRAYVAFGSGVGVDRMAALPSPTDGASFGAALASAGDLDGDGYADVLAGLGARGAVVYLGGRDALAIRRTLADPAGGDLAVHAAGDVDGDGYGDLIAVARGRGEARLYRGGASGLAADPVVLRDARWGAVTCVGAPGDVDGDGFDDVVAGAPASDAVYVFHGAASGALSSRVEALRGPAGSGFGYAVL